MPGIGTDIACVINELGTTATILRTVNITEKIMYEVNAQSTNSFMKDYYLDASFKWDTKIVPGDVLQFKGASYLVASKVPEDFEGNVVEYIATILKCNLPSTAKIVSWSQTQDTTTYEITSGWSVKCSTAYGLVYKDARGTLTEELSPTGRTTTFKLLCIVPASYNVKALDRVVVSSTEYYMVQDVEKYEYPGLHVLTLIEDTRAVYTT